MLTRHAACCCFLSTTPYFPTTPFTRTTINRHACWPLTGSTAHPPFGSPTQSSLPSTFLQRQQQQQGGSSQPPRHSSQHFQPQEAAAVVCGQHVDLCSRATTGSCMQQQVSQGGLGTSTRVPGGSGALRGLCRRVCCRVIVFGGTAHRVWSSSVTMGLVWRASALPGGIETCWLRPARACVWSRVALEGPETRCAAV